MEYKGLAIENEQIKLEDENIVGSVDLVHQGKLGGLTVNIKGNFKLMPMLEKGIDKLEELIPGDQKAVASMLKSAVRQIKIKF